MSTAPTMDLTCTLKVPSSRGGGGGKFPEPDGTTPESPRGGGGGGRKSPRERKNTHKMNRVHLYDVFPDILCGWN